MTWSPHNTIAVDDDVETWSDVEIISDEVLTPPAGNTSLSIADLSPPSLPAKTRPSSAQREKVASSLISLPRPPSRARPEGRLRGTPSPTPAEVEDEPMPKPQMQVKPDGKESV